MTRGKIYLAGPAELADSWRERAAKALEALGFDSINPMRGEVLRKKRGVDIGTDIEPKLLVTRDHYDMNQVRLSGGFFLMNFNTTEEGRKPLGTLMELEWAYLNSVPVIGIINERGTAPEIRNHPWVQELVSYKASSLRTALELIEQYFCYEVEDETKLEEED